MNLKFEKKFTYGIGLHPVSALITLIDSDEEITDVLKRWYRQIIEYSKENNIYDFVFVDKRFKDYNEDLNWLNLRLGIDGITTTVLQYDHVGVFNIYASRIVFYLSNSRNVKNLLSRDLVSFSENDLLILRTDDIVNLKHMRHVIQKANSKLMVFYQGELTEQDLIREGIVDIEPIVKEIG